MKLIRNICAAIAFLVLGGSAFSQPVTTSPVVSPQLGADRKVTLRLQAPGAQTVRIMGDFLPAETNMTKDDKGVWSYKTGPLTPGVYGYFFRLDGTRIPDPGNLLISAGASYLKSYVEVEGGQPEFWSVRDVPHGTLHEHFYKSASLGTTRRIVVYTPPGYGQAAASRKTYPALYLYHGSGDNETFWSRVGRGNFIMDNLLADGKTKPALLVMCYGHAAVPPEPEGGANGAELYSVSKIEKDLLESIIPLVEKEYRVGKEAKDRAITGLSMGGYQSLTIGLNNPSTFGYVAGFSGGFRASTDLAANFKGLLANVENARNELKFVRIEIGAKEPGGVGANQRVEEFLTSKGIPHEWVVTPDGMHSWLSWRGYLRDLLPKLFTDAG